MMERRAFLVSVGALFSRPIEAAAQQVAKPAVLGFLAPGERLSDNGRVFRDALRAHGWVEGRNLIIEFRFGGEQYERLRAFAAEFVQLKVDAIFALSAPAARAAKEATTVIPIVFHTLNDPVRAGLVASLGRPAGNLTGNAGPGPEFDQKRVELLKELVPSLSRLMVLVNPSNPMTPPRLEVIEQAGRALKIEVQIAAVSSTKILNETLQTMGRTKPEGLIVLDDPVFSFQRSRIIEAAARHQVPVVYTQSGHAAQGGLLEYAPNQSEMYRQAAAYVDRILRGAKPADLPVEQPTKFDLMINLKTARALGLAIPPSLLLRADQVIE
jgi:putative tryptophan/tyrosine transport system substrate-binding protein